MPLFKLWEKVQLQIKHFFRASVSTEFVCLLFFFELGFTPFNTEHPMGGMKLPEKEAQKD